MMDLDWVERRNSGAAACFWLLLCRYTRPHVVAPGKQVKKLADAARPMAELSASMVPPLRPEKCNGAPQSAELSAAMGTTRN